MMRLSLPGERPSPTHDAGLNLAACVDIFAAITMYLVFCYAVSDSVQRPLSDVVLPTSTADEAPVQAIKMSVSRTAVRVENQLVMQVEGASVAPVDLDEQRRVVPVLRALQREKLRLLSVPRSQTEFDAETRQPNLLYLEAARGLPYGLVDHLVRTAAAAGFTHVRMAVYHKEPVEL